MTGARAFPRRGAGRSDPAAAAAQYFDLGLANLFQPPDPKVAVAMSYGTAALIWWAITAVVVRLVRRIG